MRIFTLGTRGRSAEEFFSLIKTHKIDRVVDARLRNASQLSGFTKSADLRYFLREICRCEYSHALELAPDKELFDLRRSGAISDGEYSRRYLALVAERDVVGGFFERYPGENICILSADNSPSAQHRRIVAEMIAEAGGVRCEHL